MKRKKFISLFLLLMLLCFGCGTPEVPISEEPPNHETNGEQKEEPGLGPEKNSVVDELKSDIDAGYLILVNKTNGLANDYKPDDLADIKYFAADRSAEGRFMRETAADAFHRLVEEASSQGIEILMTTAYRSYGFQSTLYNNYVAQHGQASADRFSARPGYSEHQTGLAVDVSAASVDYSLTRDFAKTDEGIWVAANAHVFGFIIRYPEDREEQTGYLYEPWHLRYVGVTAAKHIFENEMILEEYLQFLDKEMED